jgi:hypothetical protein
MDRRTFLSLIATAPIAALAPWPSFLPKPTPMMRADALMLETLGSAVRPDLMHGWGYIRRTIDTNGDLVIDYFPN